jgi:Flp pilus assembly protein TadG
MIMKIQKLRDRADRLVRRLARDNRGVAAIEFAFIAPLLITLYLGTLEISGALQMNKKVGRAASTTADLISQWEDKNIPLADLKPILRIGTASTLPYTLTKPTMTVTGIDIESTGAKVVWSQKFDGTNFSVGDTKGSTVVLPATVNIHGGFLVKVEAKIQYRTLTSWSIKPKSGDSFGSINMAETFYFSPRNQPDGITCDECNPA